MGTRSITIIMDGNQELCRIYRQCDGYPRGHGLELAQLCDRTITNGIRGSDRNPATNRTANGMECLAAQIVAGLKTVIGDVYLQVPNGEISDWVEYVYIVRGTEGKKPTIECSTQTGPFPFNIQTKDGVVFHATPADKLVAKLQKQAA